MRLLFPNFDGTQILDKLWQMPRANDPGSGVPDSGKEEGSVRDETSPAPSQRAAPVRPDRADNHVITDGKDRYKTCNTAFLFPSCSTPNKRSFDHTVRTHSETCLNLTTVIQRPSSQTMRGYRGYQPGYSCCLLTHFSVVFVASASQPGGIPRN